MAVCQFKHRFHFLVAFAFVTNLLCPVTRAIGQIPQNRTKAKNFTVTDAISMAMKQSAVIKQYEAKLQAANEKLKSAKALISPNLSIAKGIGSGTGGLDEDLLLTQTIELGDKRRQRVIAAIADRDAAKAELDTAISDLDLAVSTAYFEAIRAKTELGLATNIKNNAANLLTAAKNQFQIGDAPRSAVIRTEIELSRAEQAVSAAETDSANRQNTLYSLIGQQDPGGLQYELNATALPSVNLFSLESYALKQRGDIKSAALGVVSKDAAYHSAKISGQPDLFLEGRHAQLNPVAGGTSLRVGLTLPLIDFGKNRADAATAKAEIKSQSALLEETKRLALLDVRSAYAMYQQAKKLIESFEGQRLSRSKELLEMAKIGYEKGATSLLEYLDAQQIYAMETTDYVRAISNLNIAAANLRHAVGGKLP